MSERNPSLTLEVADVDRYVDLLLKNKRYYVSKSTIVQMNITDSTAYNYVHARWKYRQRNHITRRSRTLMEKIKAALGDFKASDFVWNFTANKGYY